jgi:hypothetical protein
MRFAPSPVRIARLHLAAFVPFSAASIEKLRKDFLTLLKNVDRVASYEDLVKLQEASRVWDAHYEETIQGLLKGLSDTMWFVHTGDTKWNQYFEPEVKGWIAYWDKRIREGYWPLHIEMTSLPYERLEWWLKKWDGRFTAEQGKADILARWNRDKKKWSDKAKREARKAWTALDEYITWVGQRREGVAPVREVQEVYRQEVEGFSVTFIGMDRDASYLREGIQKLKVGLAHYRERAAKVFPLLLGPAKLPIQFRGDQGLDCGGRYEHGNHIVICPISSPPKEYAHVIAHEMGHHVYQTYLSEGAQRFWSAAIRGDYAEANLNDILAEWRDGEFSLDVVQRLAKTDSILALQIDGLIRQHDWGPREDAVRYLQKHGPKVHVPTTPITGYATKNTEEAFCEAVGRLVGYGPRAVHPLILHWLKIILPREVKVARTATSTRWTRRFQTALRCTSSTGERTRSLT